MTNTLRHDRIKDPTAQIVPICRKDKIFMKKITVFLLLVAMLTITACSGTPKPTESSGAGSAAGSKADPVDTSESVADTSQSSGDENSKYPNVNLESMFPVANEPVELEFCIRYDTTVYGEWEDLWFWNYMRENTNVNVVPRLIASDVYNEQKAIMLTSNDLPDVFFVENWSTSEIYEYGLQDGVFIPVTEYVDDPELMPNLNSAFKQSPEARSDSTLPDGNIYGLPTIMSDYYITASGIRAHWLNEWLLDADLKWQDIATLDDFYAALVACRDGDHNQNGTADEIPWTYYWGNTGTDGMGSVVSYILNAHGLITNDGLITVNTNTGEAGFAPMMEEYHEAVVFLNKLFEEQLLDNDLFAQTETDMAAKYAAELVAFSTYWNPGAAATPEQWQEHEASKLDNSVITSQTPLVVKDGDTPKTWGASQIRPNVFLVSKSCDIPEVAMRWADVCYDPVNSTYYRLGPEYKSDLDPDGLGWGYDAAKTMNDNWDQARADLGVTDEYTGWQWIQLHVGSAASVPFFGLDECLGMFELHPDYLSAGERAWTYPYETYIMPYETAGYPTVYYTEEENKVIELYKMALNEYATQMTAKFIAGEESLDNWEKFQEQLLSLNAQDYDNVLKSTYKAYLQN